MLTPSTLPSPQRPSRSFEFASQHKAKTFCCQSIAFAIFGSLLKRRLEFPYFKVMLQVVAAYFVSHLPRSLHSLQTARLQLDTAYEVQRLRRAHVKLNKPKKKPPKLPATGVTQNEQQFLRLSAEMDVPGLNEIETDSDVIPLAVATETIQLLL